MGLQAWIYQGVNLTDSLSCGEVRFLPIVYDLATHEQKGWIRAPWLDQPIQKTDAQKQLEGCMKPTPPEGA